MRWGQLQIDGPPNVDPQLALFGREDVVTRTFDTPEFDGMTFYEVQAKSIINRVPQGSRMGFTWTVNPYRGCSHACVYCLDGDTPVRTAQGTDVPIGQLTSGDPIIGTVPGVNGRHYVITHVLDRWESRKQAYNVVLDDGREIVASGDHRFLTPDGWAHVTDEGDGREGNRRHLTPGIVLIDSGLRPGVSGQAMAGRRIPAEARVTVKAIEPLGEERTMVDIMTGTQDFIANGVVSHNCFARGTHRYLDLDTGLDFDRKVVVKVNAPERLRQELKKHNGEHIAMGTNVDCYQRAEGRYRLMPGIIDALRVWRNPFSILTKGTLILRDLELLTEARKVTDVGLNLSIGITDQRLWRSVEPGTPSPRARLGVLRSLTEAGFEVGVLMAPVLPYLTDSPSQIAESVGMLTEAGAHKIVPIVLHLRPGAREWYFTWLRSEHPHLVRAYERLYARGAYAPAEYQQKIGDLVRHCTPRGSNG